MDHALSEAVAAAARGEVPVGAVVTDPAGRVLAVAGNRVEALGDASAAVARGVRIRASRQGDWVQERRPCLRKVVRGCSPKSVYHWRTSAGVTSAMNAEPNLGRIGRFQTER